MKICRVPRLLFIERVLLLFYFIFSVTHVFSAVRGHPHLSNASDQEALLGFMSSITYDPYQSLLTSWKPNVSFCQWTGVICSGRRHRVVSLNVSSMGLQGTISPLLGNLSFLRMLDLSNNNFHGHIPYQFGNLFRLNTLYLFLNQLQGSIPPTLGRCRSLRIISMETNNLTGTIPSWLGNISSLEYINLGRNNLHGSIPSELGMLSQLRFIQLGVNNLTGQIPSPLANCTSLQVLAIVNNHFTGNIPAEFCTKNTQLTALFMGANQLSGSIPASLFNCTKLQKISLPYNQLSGIVSTEFGKLTQLKLFSLGYNQLVSGSTTSLPILTALTNCSTLEKIYLFSNNFKGRIPFSIGHLSTKLDYINLEENELTGEIPPQIGNLTSLTQLLLDSNNFTGPIPFALNTLQNLQVLNMSSNYLQGNIPFNIGKLKSLGYLDLSQNNFDGRIPESIANLQQLRYLYLFYNQLSGNIPRNLGKCVNLLDLDLSYNRLTGKIPPEVAGLGNLALSFNLSNNLFHGPVPLGLSKMTMLQAIDVSANQLTGYIPSTLQSCKELEYLNLSHNALGGPIPITLNELQSLEVMDLSYNNLSGGIPLSLEKLKLLSHCNFSFNKLSGEVPKGGIFKNLGAMAFMGNPDLCGPWVSLRPCYAHKHQSFWHTKRFIIPMVIAAVIVVLCLFLGILRIQNRKKHSHTEIMASFTTGHQRISYGEIMTATNEFSDANLLGVGSFGKVYKGVLNDGTLVAVKLLNLENEGGEKAFDKECKVLGKVRHRNLIRIITYYSDLQMKALIFPLMQNGSLEKWLYPNGQEESKLSLFQRLNIAIDIAQGMTYLHHHCFVQVLHCDLKPSNVLLGEDMTAYITDFGIASVHFANSKDSEITSTHALKGSIGYIPPEYGLGGRATTKGDVYSYGIVLLEILTRKKLTHNIFVEGMILQKWEGSGFLNLVKDVVDGNLLRKTSMGTAEDKELNCLSQLISLGLFCTKESPERRPTMMDIVSTLQSIKETFLGVTGIPKLQLEISHLLGSTSTTPNNIGEGQSSSSLF
eukprot:PITA_27389